MILCYHHIAPAEQAAANRGLAEGWELTHTPEQLERHLAELSQRGFRFVTLPDLVLMIARRGWEPWNKVAITFDDGWADNYTYALPILRKVRAPATFFITTEHIHQQVTDRERMNVDHLKEVLRCGMTIGSHSRTHPNLLEIRESQARNEIAGSKTDLEQALGTRVDLFAYPHGAHHSVQVDLVRAAGYSAAVVAGRGAQNSRLGMFWLFRYGLSAGMDSPEDRQAFNPLRGVVRGLYRDLRKKLGWPIQAAPGRKGKKSPCGKPEIGKAESKQPTSGL